MRPCVGQAEQAGGIAEQLRQLGLVVVEQGEVDARRQPVSEAEVDERSQWIAVPILLGDAGQSAADELAVRRLDDLGLTQPLLPPLAQSCPRACEPVLLRVEPVAILRRKLQ